MSLTLKAVTVLSMVVDPVLFFFFIGGARAWRAPICC